LKSQLYGQLRGKKKIRRFSAFGGTVLLQSIKKENHVFDLGW